MVLILNGMAVLNNLYGLKIAENMQQNHGILSSDDYEGNCLALPSSSLRNTYLLKPKVWINHKDILIIQLKRFEANFLCVCL